MSFCESFFNFCRLYQPVTQNSIGHILDGQWERHSCLSVLHMTICYQNEFEDGTKTSCPKNHTSKSVKLLHSVTLKVIDYSSEGMLPWSVKLVNKRIIEILLSYILICAN